MCSIEKPNCNPRSHNKIGVFILNGYNSWESADDATSVVRNRLTSARSSTGRVSSSHLIYRYTYNCGRLPLVAIEARLGIGRTRRTRRMTIQYLYVRMRTEGPRYYGVIGERTGTFAILRESYKILSRTFLPVNNTKYVL